jgi:uncharacterized protein YbaR (Trm112 family)
MVHPKTESFLRCPRCRGALARKGAANETLVGYDCHACAVRYPSRDGVVDFTPDAATPLAEVTGS